MRIHCLSDTHNGHENFSLPGGDLLIHAGDISSRGSEPEITKFLEWYAAQPYTNKVLTAGNHDWGFQHNPNLYSKMCQDLSIHLLNDSGVTIEGVKIWGSPISPWFCNWAFNVHRGDPISAHWSLIPIDTDILVTHGPPAGILDLCGNGSVGCEDLLRKVLKTQVKLHIFGHIHEGRGVLRKHGRLYVNCSALDGHYRPLSGVPIKIVKSLSGHKYTPESLRCPRTRPA